MQSASTPRVQALFRAIELINQRKHQLFIALRLLKDFKCLRSSVGIYYSWYAVSFKLPTDIGYVHQNLQLKQSVTYLFSLMRRKLTLYVEWSEKIPFEFP